MLCHDNLELIVDYNHAMHWTVEYKIGDIYLVAIPENCFVAICKNW